MGVSDGAFGETLFDATVVAQNTFCETLLAKKCKVPEGDGTPNFKSVDECKSQGQSSIENLNQKDKAKNISNFGKCVNAIKEASTSDDCLKITSVPNTAPDCMN